ncbi:MAG: Vgb family protein, partial [Planctomycetota bacterium]
ALEAAPIEVRFASHDFSQITPLEIMAVAVDADAALDPHASLALLAQASGQATELVPSGSGGLAQASGVAIGPDGNLYVASFTNHQVLRYDVETGAFIDAFVSVRSGGLTNPTDAVFGSDGNLYVTSFGTDCVLRYDGQTGAFIDVFVAAGADGLVDPDALTFGPDGHLYVLSGAQASVRRFDGSTGAFIDVFIPSGSGGMTDPQALFFGPDDLLYVTASGDGKVLRFDAASGAFIDVFVQDDPSTPLIDESGGLVGARGAAFGPDGRLYVTSFGSNQVLRYDGQTGAFIDVFVSALAGASGPTDVLFGPPSIVPGDFNGDGIVNIQDLLQLLDAWGPCSNCPEDLDGDGDVDIGDLLALLANWT